VTDETGSITDYQMGGPGDKGSKTDGAPAVHPLGIRFQGPWEQPADGFNEHVRRNARALALTGCPLNLLSLKPTFFHTEKGSDDERILYETAHLREQSIGRYGAIIQMLVPTEGLLDRLLTPSQMAMRALEMDDYLRLQKTKVFYTVWERSPVPPDDAQVLSKAGQAWVPTRHARDLLLEAGVPEAQIRIVPMPVFADDPLLQLDGRERALGPPVFYHIGKWEPRKDQHRILGNFLRAFRPEEAIFLLKSGAFASGAVGYPKTALASVRHWMTHDARVRDSGWRWEDSWTAREAAAALGQQGLKIFEVKLSDEHLRRFHEMGDVYVSLSHGEGWDMPAFDAKLAGNLMVYTPSGGPQDFAGDKDLLVKKSGLVDCHALYHWPKGSQYIDYDDDEAILALRVAASRVLDGQRCRGMDATRFDALRVGQAMLRHLREIAPGLPGDAG
jgi:hypothetical protein